MNADFIDQFHFNDSTRVTCPLCSPERRKQNQKDMTLTRKPDGAVVYHCHHCYSNGSIQPHKERKLSAVPAVKITSNKLQDQHYDYLKTRGISPETADRMRLFAADKYFSRLSKTADAIGFPYYRDGALVSAKYRSFPEKDFTQDAGGAHDFFGLDEVKKGEPIIIVEGEIDCLTLMEAGLNNVVSVPGGAPIKVADGKVSASEDKKFAFVWNAREIIDAAPYVVIATDQDIPGQALAEELARRIGKDKCRLAKFNGKDLNEVFLNAKDDFMVDDPSQVLKDIVDGATPYPIAGLSDPSVFEDRLNDMFAKGVGRGFSTGYQSVDSVYTVVPGQMTVVTGYPSSGKSNFVDQVMVNLARAEDWKFAVCSFENAPEIHISRLMEIYMNKRFFEGKDRMTADEKSHAFKWVKDHFLFIDTNGEEPSTMDSILERSRVAVKRMGARGLVIDPYNYIDLNKGASETQAISDMLTRVQKFCKANDCHTWFVAHPSKITRSGVEQPRPDGMSISGSMAWWAKTDVGITVHRGQDRDVQIAVWKCRHRWVGAQGETVLQFNPTAGTYTETLDAF
jgi:twinkle protein